MHSKSRYRELGRFRTDEFPERTRSSAFTGQANFEHFARVSNNGISNARCLAIDGERVDRGRSELLGSFELFASIEWFH